LPEEGGAKMGDNKGRPYNRQYSAAPQ
jgi:hypothetical protein